MHEFAPKDTDALIIIDVQNDFISGSLAVPSASGVFRHLTPFAERFKNVVLTQDWHPRGHSSFAASNPGKAPFETIDMPYGPQTLWPVHCLQGDHGAELSLPKEITDKAQLIIRKGFRPDIDSYSAFMENDKTTTTGLAAWLQARGITRIVLAGLATDYCVGFSALDGRAAGFDVVVALAACRGIAQESTDKMVSDMSDAGVKLI